MHGKIDDILGREYETKWTKARQLAALTGRGKLNLEGTGDGRITMEFRAMEGMTDGKRLQEYVDFLRYFVERFKDEKVLPSPRFGSASNNLESLLPGKPGQTWILVGDEPDFTDIDSLTPQERNIVKFLQHNNLDIVNEHRDTILLQEIVNSVAEDTSEAAQREMLEFYGSTDPGQIIQTAFNGVNKVAKASEGIDPRKVVQQRVRQLSVSLDRGDSVGVIGRQVTGPEELAVMGQFVRNPSHENTWVVYVKDGKIKEHEVVTLNSSQETAAPKISQLRERVEAFEADGFLLLHNHPGGVAKFSDGDITVSNLYAYENSDIFMGAVVINSGTYAHMMRGEDGIYGLRGQPVNEQQLPSELVGWDTDSPYQLYGSEHIRSADPLYQDVVIEEGVRDAWQEGIANGEFQKHILGFGKYLNVDDNWITVAFTSADNRLEGLVEFRGLQQLSTPELYRFLSDRSESFGGHYTHIFVGEGDWYASSQEAVQPFLDIRTAQDAGELPVGGIASVTVMGDNFTNLGADVPWRARFGASPVELSRSFDDDLPPLERLGRITTSRDIPQEIKGSPVYQMSADEFYNIIGRQFDQRLKKDAEHITGGGRKSYDKIMYDDAVKSQGELDEVIGGNMLLTDLLAFDNLRVFTSYGERLRTQDAYGFIFDAEKLVSDANATVGRDLVQKYSDAMEETIKNVMSEHGLEIQSQERVNQIYHALHRYYDSGELIYAPELEKWTGLDLNTINKAMHDIKIEFFGKSQEIQKTNRVSGEDALNRLEEYDVGTDTENVPEIVVDGEIPLKYVVGVIESGEVRMLTPESRGHPPEFWEFEDGKYRIRGHADDGPMDDDDFMMPRAMEHMTGSKEKFEKIKREGQLKWNIPDGDGEIEELVWLSAGAMVRKNRPGSYGFLFDPHVIDEKYNGLPSLSNLLNADRNALKDNPHLARIVGVDSDQMYAYTYDELEEAIRNHMQELGYTLENVMEISELPSEVTVNGNISIKDAVAVVEDGDIKVITEETRGLRPDQWEYREPTEDELRQSFVGSTQDLWLPGRETPDYWKNDYKYKKNPIDLESPILSEHMSTHIKSKYDEIKKDGQLKSPSYAMDKSIWFSKGAYLRTKRNRETSWHANWGFLFDPDVLAQKYHAAPNIESIYEADGVVKSEVDAMKEDVFSRRYEMTADEYLLEKNRVYGEYLKSKGLSLNDVLKTPYYPSEIVAVGPIDLNDAVGVVEDGEVKIITEATRGKSPDEWEFREPTEEELVQSAYSPSDSDIDVDSDPIDFQQDLGTSSVADTLIAAVDTDGADPTAPPTLPSRYHHIKKGSQERKRKKLPDLTIDQYKDLSWVNVFGRAAYNLEENVHDIMRDTFDAIVDFDGTLSALSKLTFEGAMQGSGLKRLIGDIQLPKVDLRDYEQEFLAEGYDPHWAQSDILTTREGREELMDILGDDRYGEYITERQPESINVDTELFNTVWNFYKDAYGLSDNGMAGLKRYIAEQPAEFMGDMALLATFGAKAVGTGVKATGMARRSNLVRTLRDTSAFNQYVPANIMEAVRDGWHLSKYEKLLPDELKPAVKRIQTLEDFGSQAYYVGTGVKSGQYPPGFWSRMAEGALRYMDAGGAPLAALQDTIGTGTGLLSGRSRRGAEHMTHAAETYETIIKSGKLGLAESSYHAANAVYLSPGVRYRNSDGFNKKWGFIFDPDILFEKYNARATLGNFSHEHRRAILRKIMENLGEDPDLITERIWKGQYDPRSLIHKTALKHGKDPEKFELDTIREYMIENDMSLNDIFTSDPNERLELFNVDEFEYIADGPIDIKDAVGVIEDGQIKVITDETRGKSPIEWEFRAPATDELDNTMINDASRTKELDDLVLGDTAQKLHQELHPRILNALAGVDIETALMSEWGTQLILQAIPEQYRQVIGNELRQYRRLAVKTSQIQEKGETQ